MDENVVRVRMLGEFSLSCGGVKIGAQSSRSFKVWLLIAYLIYYRDRMVPRGELLKLVGNEEKNADPVTALRMTRMRARRVLEPLRDALGIEPIIGKDGAYGWNPELRTEPDAAAFEDLCTRGAAARDEHAKIEYFQKALALYRGDFLEKLGGGAWVETMAAYYHNLYLHTAEDTLPLLRAAGCDGEAAELARSALRLSPYHEPLYQALMSSLIAMGDCEGAEAVYRELRELLVSELDVLPSEETRIIYEEAAQQQHNAYLAPDLLRKLLREPQAPEGALICDYAMFKLFYQAEARSADRRGDAIHIGILTVSAKYDRDLSEREQERAMGQLRAKLQDVLRIGDVAARCSASQYVVMLLQADYENSKMVCRRVVNAFARDYPRSPARIDSAVMPLEPAGAKSAASEKTQ